MDKHLIERFEHDLRNAQKAAQNVDVDDGGTCNHDKPYVFTDYEDEFREAANRVDGIRLSEGYGIADGGLFIFGPIRGQGNRRTKTAEAVAQQLDGTPELEASTFYAID